MRRRGFLVGNLSQTPVLVLPHLLLLAIDVQLWLIIPVQFLAEWLLGLFRFTSDCFVPGSLSHGIDNLIAGLIVG